MFPLPNVASYDDRGITNVGLGSGMRRHRDAVRARYRAAAGFEEAIRSEILKLMGNAEKLTELFDEDAQAAWARASAERSAIVV